MSRYAQNHPEQFEPGGSGFDPLFDRADQQRKERREMGLGHDPEVPAGFQDADIEQAELERAARELRPCAACGEPTTGHWCSDSCRRQEDGLSAEEADLIDNDEEEDV